MPAAVGLLTCLCVGGLLPRGAVESARRTGAGRAGFAETLALWARSIGSRLPEGLVQSHGIALLGDEVIRVVGPEHAEDLLPVERAQTGAGLVLLACGVGCVAGAVVALSVWGAVVGAAAPIALCGAAAARRRRDDARRIEAAMPEAFGALAISLGSGHSLGQAMRFVGSHAEEPVRTEFLRVSSSMVCGIPASEALDDMLRRLPAPGLELVSLALKVSQRTGAPLKGLLEDAANTVGERMELARRLDVKTSQARMSARLVALMPVAMIALLTLFSSDFRQGLGTVTGMVSVAVAAALNLCAWMIIRKIMEVRI